MAIFASCKKEDEAVVCKNADFVGTWKQNGSACILTDATTLTITDLGSNKINGVYKGPNGLESQFDSWTLNGCGFTGKVIDTDLLIDINVTGTLSNGKLTIVNTGKALGSSINCTENLTK